MPNFTEAKYTINLKVIFKNSRKQRICINKYTPVNTFAHAETSLLTTKNVLQNDK